MREFYSGFIIIFMNFLIITDNHDILDNISKLIKSLEKSAKITHSDFSKSNFQKIKKTLDSLSLCIIFSKTEKQYEIEEISRLCSFSGYLIANHIALVTNLHFISDYNLFGKESLKYVESENDLSKFIKTQYNQILDFDKKRCAKKLLLNKGIPFTSDCFALYIEKNKSEIFDLFLEAGIDVNSTDDLGTPMLNIAVRNDNEEFTKRLLELHANINAISKDRGYTAVMDAVWRGNLELTKLLISKGADLNTINKEGQNNLVLAVGADKDKIVKLLVENGANPDIKDQMGMSAYGYATLFRKEKIIEILKPYHKEN